MRAKAREWIRQRRSMRVDSRYCFLCDARLADHPLEEEGRLRFCARCEADLGPVDQHGAVDPTGIPAMPAFMGAVGLRVVLPHWPTEVALVGLNVWDGLIELRHIERTGDDPPPPHPRMVATAGPLGLQTPRKFGIHTDVGSVHYGHGGGGGTRGTDTILCGEAILAPALPQDVTRIAVVAQAPGTRTELAIDLTGWPAPITDARVEIDDPVHDTGCRSCGGLYVSPESAPVTGLSLDWSMAPPPMPVPQPPRDRRPICAACRDALHAVCQAKQPPTALPEAVLALNARLPGAIATDLVIPTLTCWPTWFDLDVTGPVDGPWGASLANPGKTWSIDDDRGNRYIGACLGGSSRFDLSTHHLSFIPALDPSASTLTLTFPPSIDGTSTSTTVGLPARHR
jgi:hypothetical protein